MKAKNLTPVKALFLFFVVIISFTECKKDEPVVLPTVTGAWNKTYTFTSGSDYSGTMNLVQQADGKVTGNFVLNDNSGSFQLLSSSKINGNNVTIDWMLAAFTLSFQGTVNSAFNSMSGSFYSDGTKKGTWVANKESAKGSSISGKKSGISENDQLLKFLKEF